MCQFDNELKAFSSWVKLADIEKDSVPNKQIVYIVRAIQNSGNPVLIKRARQEDPLGIVNIGSGKGNSRIKKLKESVYVERKDWKRKHHQLFLWWEKFDFNNVLKIEKSTENIEVCWSVQEDKSSSQKKEKDMLILYKLKYADLPIGNLKSW